MRSFGVVSVELNTGLVESMKIVVNWVDHNDVQHRTLVDLAFTNPDKPKTLAKSVDGTTVAAIFANNDGSGYDVDH